MADTPQGALVLFSGGQDSAVCLAWALARYTRVETVGFDYGQRHAIELVQRPTIRHEIGRLDPGWRAKLGPDRVIDVRAFGAIGESALTTEHAIKAPPGALPSTFVPGRNLVFLAYAAALAERRGLDLLVAGMCETDFSGYPDCRRVTLDAMEEVLRLGIERPFPIVTPLMSLTKAKTWALAMGLGGEALVELIVEETHTCYRGERGVRADWGHGCGHCPACDLRAKGWREWVAAGRPALAP